MKKKLRKQLMQRLEQFTLKEKTMKAQRLSHHLIFYLNNHGYSSSLIGGFAPLADEPMWLDEEFGKLNLCFPWISGESMEFKKCSPQELVEVEIFGRKMRSPTKGHQTICPEVILVPGVGFTKRGERLGRGKGFYDRYLKKFMGPKIALCFNEQIVDQLPIEEHDQKVDMVITDSGPITMTSKG